MSAHQEHTTVSSFVPEKVLLKLIPVPVVTVSMKMDALVMVKTI